MAFHCLLLIFFRQRLSDSGCKVPFTSWRSAVIIFVLWSFSVLPWSCFLSSPPLCHSPVVEFFSYGYPHFDNFDSTNCDVRAFFSWVSQNKNKRKCCSQSQIHVVDPSPPLKKRSQQLTIILVLLYFWLDPNCIPVRVFINRLHLVPEWMEVKLVRMHWNARSQSAGRWKYKVLFFLTAFDDSCANVNFATFTGNPTNHTILHDQVDNLLQSPLDGLQNVNYTLIAVINLALSIFLTTKQRQSGRIRMGCMA